MCPQVYATDEACHSLEGLARADSEEVPVVFYWKRITLCPNAEVDEARLHELAFRLRPERDNRIPRMRAKLELHVPLSDLSSSSRKARAESHRLFQNRFQTLIYTESCEPGTNLIH